MLLHGCPNSATKSWLYNQASACTNSHWNRMPPPHASPQCSKDESKKRHVLECLPVIYTAKCLGFRVGR